jgi:7-carboxy-7-deazaguanine synthase
MWCDTPQTWVYNERKVEKHQRINVPFDVKNESTRWTSTEITDKLKALGAERDDLIVISGGEPMLQVDIEQLVQYLVVGQRTHYRAAIETAGTIVPNGRLRGYWDRLHWNVSIKLSGSGNPEHKRIVPEAIDAYVDMGADIKFVVKDEGDQEEVEELVHRFSIPPKTVWIMPEGIDAVTILDRARKFEKWVTMNKFNLTLRQHILLFGDARGR